MKQRFSFFILIFLFLFDHEVLHAQHILGGLSVGFNLTQLDGDQFYGFNQAGISVGPMAVIPFGKQKKWSVSLELLFTQKGSYHRGATDTTYYRLRLQYAEIPVLAHFTDKKNVSAGLGFCYGQLIGVKESSQLFMVPHSDFSNDEVSVVVEGQVRMWDRLWLGVRYQYSILSLRKVTIVNPYNPKDTWDRDQYNNVITIRLSYVFKQDIPIKNRKK
jgi:hypothetical protein